MSNSEQDEEASDLEPWANDVRLKDFKHQGTINKVVRLILKLADAMQKAPIGPMRQSSHHDTTILNSTKTKHHKFVDR